VAEWHDAGPANAVAEEATVGLSVAGTPIALFRLDGEVFALHDLCTHGQARLSEGYVEGGCVECPLHQGLVDIRTGAARAAPISVATRTYPARVVDGRVQVEV